MLCAQADSFATYSMTTAESQIQKLEAPKIHKKAWYSKLFPSVGGVAGKA
ncbi:MAG: hypothetical protein JSS06_10785 [Proteobacteria bacterium]|nr:hypothetical protein [Pseudomonadota bacterium]